VKIITQFVYPPIPVRNMDWQAVTDDYDCDCDQDGYFSHHPMGHGATEAEAIADLRDQLWERAADVHKDFQAWCRAEGFLPPERSELAELGT
jgi:hypothetical protein